MNKISAFIIAKNESKRIEAAINSVKNIAEEIIVIDSGSTDNTVAIAESLGARVVYNEWPGYVNQKIFGETLCKNDWILNIDADEELSKGLQDEIAFIFESGVQDKYYAYIMNVVILHRSDRKPRFLAPRNKCVRLYNKNHCSFASEEEKTTHDSVRFNDEADAISKCYKLCEPAYHRSGTSIEQLVNKANFYSGEQAKDLIRDGRAPSKIRIAFELPLWFLKAFFIRRYFVFGFEGFVDSIIFAFTRFMRLAKTREIKNN